MAYFGQMYMSDSELNRSGTGTEELDAKILELQQIGDGDEQIARANELEKEALGTYGIMPFANGPDMVAVADPSLQTTAHTPSQLLALKTSDTWSNPK